MELDFTPDKTKFKNSQGMYILQGIFFEYGHMTDHAYTQYTLKDEAHQGYPSLRELYVTLADPTEYTFANTYLGGWPHFQKLIGSHFFTPFIDQWREEVEIKLQAKALAELTKMANDPDAKNYYNANKLLLDKGWKEKKAPITRTAKKKIFEEATKMGQSSATISDDYNTIIMNKPN